MVSEFAKVFDRDIERIKNEIELFHLEENIWRTTGSIKNSAGNLSLHLVGNLQTYIGRNMGGFDYIRDREAEFNLKDVPRKEIVLQTSMVKERVLATLSQLDQEKLEERYVEDVLGYPMTNGYFLIHLTGHLSYHLGQINYIRRFFE
jgi:uncharacterized damage-inducible protein DinB